jgi:hypothetical protein
VKVISKAVKGGDPEIAVTYRPTNLLVLKDLITVNDLSNVPV